MLTRSIYILLSLASVSLASDFDDSMLEAAKEQLESRLHDKYYEEIVGDMSESGLAQSDIADTVQRALGDISQCMVATLSNKSLQLIRVYLESLAYDEPMDETVEKLATLTSEHTQLEFWSDLRDAAKYCHSDANQRFGLSLQW